MVTTVFSDESRTAAACLLILSLEADFAAAPGVLCHIRKVDRGRLAQDDREIRFLCCHISVAVPSWLGRKTDVIPRKRSGESRGDCIMTICFRDAACVWASRDVEKLFVGFRKRFVAATFPLTGKDACAETNFECKKLLCRGKR